MSEAPVQRSPVEADHTQLYDILISHLTDFAVFLTDQQGVIVSWNPGVERLLGYSEREWLGQPVELIFTAEDRAAGVPGAEIKTAAATGQSPDVRWHLRKDGTRLFVEGTLVALRDHGGRLLGFSKVMRDITDRKRREQQLQDALAYAEGIVNTVSEPLLLLDGSHQVHYANLSFYRNFQVSKEQTENRSLLDLCEGQWNDPQVLAMLDEIALDSTAIDSVELERDFPHLGGRTMILKARRLWREGTNTGLTLLAIEDVTERKQAEQARAESEKQLRLLMNAAPAIISYIDRNLRYRLANGAYERWFGIAPGDLIGKSLFELFDAPLFSAIQPHIERALKGETVSFEEDYPVLSGGIRTVHITYTPDVNELGQVRGFMVLGSDTSERTATERALRASEERWRSLFELMSEGFFVGELLYNQDGKAFDFRFAEVNPAFERLTGVADALGKTIREAIFGIQEELIQTCARVVQSGEPAHFELCIPALNEHWYEARARHTEGDRFAVLFLDITERKRAEIQLQENVRRQSALLTLGDRLRDLKDIPSLTSAAMEIVGTVLRVDRAGYGEVDATQEYITIENSWSSERVFPLTGTYRFSDFGLELGGRLRRGETINISDVARDPVTAAQSEHWKELDITALINLPLLQNGRLVAVLFIQSSTPRLWTEADLTFVRKVADRTWAAAERAHALTELQQSEEFNRSVLASTPDCVEVLDLAVDRNWIGFWAGAEQAAEEAVQKARAGQIAKFESFSADYQGTPKWWEIVLAPIRDASGNPMRILSLSRDITERKAAERERDRLTAELKRSNEELLQFAQIVAHDLQSPLRGVINFSQLLAMRASGVLGQDEQMLLDQIVESARRMHQFVQAVLKFAQVGQGEIGSQQVEMDEVAESAVRSLQTEIDEHRANITRESLPKVMGDSVQLEQLLQNLVGNALKYRRAEEVPQIAIKSRKQGTKYVFSVQDNGEGIAPQYLERVFEPLKRLHGADLPGTGLGLTICQRIVARHGGRIWAESVPGLGSTFYFTLQAA